MYSSRSKYQDRQPVVVLRLLALTAAAIVFGNATAMSQSAKQVSLYVDVERGGKLIQGLGPQNFRLFQDNEAQRFRLEKPETPMSIALLVEYSQSSYPYLSDIQSAMDSFLDVAPEGNWYALATYSHSLQVQVDFTKRAGRIPDAFSQLAQPVWDETDTYDAIYEMLDKMGRLSGRRVLIVIGSGLDSYSEHSFDDVQKEVEANNILVYSVGAGSGYRGIYQPYLDSMQQMDLLQAQSFLQMLADKSGGQAWFPKEEAAYPDIMKGIMQDLQNQYRLVYELRKPTDQKLHKIKVEAFQIQDDKRTDFKVRVREGWRF